MSKMVAAALALVLAPVVSTVLFAFSGMLTEGGVAGTKGALVLVYLYSLAAGLVLGLPLLLLGLRLNLVRWWTALVAGIVAGGVAMFIFSLPDAVTAHNLAYAGAIGAPSGLAFWLIWIQGRSPAEAAANNG